jgi:hypothetical protein
MQVESPVPMGSNGDTNVSPGGIFSSEAMLTFIPAVSTISKISTLFSSSSASLAVSSSRISSTQ